MTFEGKPKWFNLEENSLQTVQEWTKSYIELIALYVHPKSSNHLRLHLLRAIMALDLLTLVPDHSRLGLENKFLGNKSTSLLCKICWGEGGERVNRPIILFIRHIWGETVLWGAVFIIQTSDSSISQFEIQIALIQYSGRSKHAWAFSKSAKKIFKITYTASWLRAVECLNEH